MRLSDYIPLFVFALVVWLGWWLLGALGVLLAILPAALVANMAWYYVLRSRGLL